MEDGVEARAAPGTPVGSPGAGAGRPAPSMGWVQAGFITFAFAAPSACVGVAYSIGMAGIVGGSLLCLITTLASIGGSMMLLRIRLENQDCRTFGDLGERVLGKGGRIWGDIIQQANFLLFLPVAMLFCGEALQGVVQISAFGGCSDYYVFTIAAICLLTTQLRSFSNTQVLSFISLVSVFAMAVLQMLAALLYTRADRVPALAFGNPDTHWLTRTTQALLGTTTAAWAYVPAFLTVELTSCMAKPEQFGRSLLLSGFLNVVIFIGVGITVVARWGYDVQDPVTLTRVAAWRQGGWLDVALSACLLVGNFVSYMLDSVPLARYCQKVWAPGFRDRWSPGDIARYFVYTLPTFLFGLLLSVFVPNLFVLLSVTTALTVPWVTQIYPAVLYLKLFGRGGSARLLGDGGADGPRKLAPSEMAGALAVLLIGCASFAICTLAAVGKAALPQVRGPSQIGCGGWRIWSG